MTGRRLYVITAAMMLSLFLASIESTVVATALPTIVAQLGGLSIYAWVFSAYMLASTTALPIFGKLSDIYGRRPIYLIAVTIFLVGSASCGQAQTMPELILFRAFQGLGAGGLQPLAFTIIGDIFDLEQRAKMQGLFSGVWGVSSVVGPLVGGFLVDQVSWRWVFYINIVPGITAVVLMIAAWRDVTPRSAGRVDLVGAALLSGAIVALLLAMFELNSGSGWDATGFWSLLVLSVALLAALLWVESHVANPIFPLPLFRDRLFSTAIGHGFASGFAMFGSASFIPFFVESVLGTSATMAGATLTPQLIGWVCASIIGSRLLLRTSYRSLAVTGMTSVVAGSFMMMLQVGANTAYWTLIVNVALMGAGMGLAIPSFMIAVQSSVPRQALGAATATLQFSRNIGGTIGVSLMGVILTLRLTGVLSSIGVDPNSVALGSLLNPAPGTTLPPHLDLLRDALARGVQGVFAAAFVAAIVAWIVAALAPRGRIGRARATSSPETGPEAPTLPAE